MRRVVVTGLGAITPLGVGVRRTWTRLLAGDSGIVSVADREPAARWKELTSTVAGVVPCGEGEGRWRASDWLAAGDQRRMSRFTQYAVAATDMALRDAGWEPSRPEDLENTGVCLGSGIGNLDEIYETSLAHHNDGYKKVSPMFVPKILINMAAGHIAMKHGFYGPNHAATTACTTGAHSIGDAARFIALGDASVMVAGGSESCIHPLTFAGFGRARSLSTAYNDDPEAACRPFDLGRDGFVVAEGAAVCILEELEHAKARGARIYAEVRGYGCSGDAHHMTAPREDGQGAYSAMKKALKNAGVKPRQVDYINAHATGTKVGDVAEATAIRRLMLGDEGVSNASEVTVSSTKGAIGHLLGAAGAIEALFSILAIHELAGPDPDRYQRTRQPDLEPLLQNFTMACESCRSQTRALVRIVARAKVSKPSTTTIPSMMSALSHVRPSSSSSRIPSVRYFSDTSSKQVLGGFGRSMTDSYRVIGASERLYKFCAKPADYRIPAEARKNDQVERLEDGEEVGRPVDPGNVWHDAFKLQPTFSTWSHVTMLHLYLLNARVRCFERDAYRTWQQQLIDHFFFECEKKMHVDHNINSSALRQRYLKDIFVQWRGLLLAYDEGLVKGDAILASAVWRNLFKGSPDVDPRALAAIVGWMRSTLLSLEATSDANLPVRAEEIFEKPVEVFWTRLEGAFAEEGRAKAAAAAAQGEPVAATAGAS
ncbi:hypothetical protein S40293_01981 [Stachybotrys chartarum IBT 40293]|nr:hypothetical protein S40293_01981 [Stachybotrys chartarum IBT 40293]